MRIKLVVAAACIVILVMWFTSDEWQALWTAPVAVPHLEYVPMRHAPTVSLPTHGFVNYDEWDAWIATRAPTKSGDWDELIGTPPPFDVPVDPLILVDDVAPPIHVKQWEPPPVPAYIEPQYYHPSDPYRPPRRRVPGVPEPHSLVLLFAGLCLLLIARRIK